MMTRVFKRPISALVGGVCLLALFALVPRIFPSAFLRTALGDLIPLVVVTATVIVATRNAVESRGQARLFWGLISLGMAMWWFNQASWSWFEVILRKPLPDPFLGDVVLYLHVVPIMAAVVLRRYPTAEGEELLSSTLNVLILLVWWIVVYAFIVFPDEYIVMNVRLYSQNWDVLYILEGLILCWLAGWAYLKSEGAWKELYGTIFLASVVYSLASQAINAATLRGDYISGGLRDVPLLAAFLGFYWVALLGRRYLRETQVLTAGASAGGTLAPRLAKVAMLSLPLMGYWALYLGSEATRLRYFRFEVAMGGLAALGFIVFLKQHLLDRRLVQLVEQSNLSYDNLHRLQGRVIQQEKLASLGELVALAASELEYPLAGILESSDRLAASNRLKTEQISTARKIGQQARRTRELVNDLLSFAQQTPGEKVPLDLKPLAQRAAQMEGFKLEKNQDISLNVLGDESLPLVLGNSNQLLQAFLQIVENAVDALQDAGGGRLVISLRQERQEVVLEFADTGPGLAHPERVFDPFYTTKPVGKGTGLGLSATYGVIQDHKGQITCHNHPEGGAVFEIRLPAIKVSTQAAARA